MHHHTSTRTKGIWKKKKEKTEKTENREQTTPAQATVRPNLFRFNYLAKLNWTFAPFVEGALHVYNPNERIGSHCTTQTICLFIFILGYVPPRCAVCCGQVYLQSCAKWIDKTDPWTFIQLISQIWLPSAVRRDAECAVRSLHDNVSMHYTYVTGTHIVYITTLTAAI